MDPRLHKLVCDALFVHNLDRMDRVRRHMKHIREVVFVRLDRRTAQRLLLITSAHLFRPQVGHKSNFSYLNPVELSLSNSDGQKFFGTLYKTDPI